MSRAQVDAKLNAEGRCRLCLRPGRLRPLTRHRVVPGHAGGRYIPVNCVPLCRPCHDLVDNREPATRRMVRRMLRAALWPEEIAHAYRHRYWSFDGEYPKPSREVVLEVRRQLAA